MAKKPEQSKAYKELRQSMMDSLEARGMVEAAYADKVREYMNFWVQLQQLEADVAQRGVSVLDEKRGMMVENRSISLAVQVSRQMLAIYTALGFKDEGPRQGGEDDEL